MRKLLITSLSLLVAVLVSALILWSLGTEKEVDGSACPEEQKVDQPEAAPAQPTLEPETATEVAEPEGAPAEPVTLEPESAEGLQIELGRSRSPITTRFFLEVPETSPALLPRRDDPLAVVKRPLRRDETYGVIDNYFAEMRVTATRQVELKVCVQPKGIDPGTYRGLVTSDDPSITGASVPITVTLQYQRWRLLAVWFGLVVLLAGSVFVFAATAREQERERVLLPEVKEFPGWWLRSLFPVGVGIVAAASAFTATYLADAGWGAQAPQEWFALLGAMFTAFVAGMTGGRASPELVLKRPSHDEADQETAEPEDVVSEPEGAAVEEGEPEPEVPEEAPAAGEQASDEDSEQGVHPT